MDCLPEDVLLKICELVEKAPLRLVSKKFKKIVDATVTMLTVCNRARIIPPPRLFGTFPHLTTLDIDNPYIMAAIARFLQTPGPVLPVTSLRLRTREFYGTVNEDIEALIKNGPHRFPNLKRLILCCRWLITERTYTRIKHAPWKNKLEFDFYCLI